MTNALLPAVRDGSALAVPASGELMRPGVIEAFELDVRERVRSIEDVPALVDAATLANALAKALAKTKPAPYAMAAARRIEWQLGRVLGPNPGKMVHVVRL